MAIQKKSLTSNMKSGKKPAPKAAKPSTKLSTSDSVTPSMVALSAARGPKLSKGFSSL